MSAPRALGEQGLHVVRTAAATALDVDRAARRQRIEEASQRPAPGSSDLLGRPLVVHTTAAINPKGELRAVDTYDLVHGLSMWHLSRGK